ncbi:MAG: bifunctional homocysteine S-methyltransferase/methylenetetrahydrofolate reductase [Lachnospiraceae bacterium]|nr:bifunctional homocysteine S-methyltransferase/methylenetetrahydrofolate reductase [Lachnospiraceae bacterium]
MDFLNDIKEKIIVSDGAMGTYYKALYPDDNGIVERAVLSHPERIEDIHRRYIKAGATFIRTDSFACAGPFISSSGEAAEIARASYRIARKAAGSCYVAADIGTIFDPAMEGSLLSDIRPVIDAFLSEGAEIFDFETQTQTEGLSEIFSYIREKKREAIILVSFSINKAGMTTGGLSVDNIMRYCAEEENIDGYGFNCGVGPSHMASIIERAHFYCDKPFIVMPNAGYPYTLRGRQIYRGDKEIFSDKLGIIVKSGAALIGGCCGTDPDFISRISEKFGHSALYPKQIMELSGKKKRTRSSFYKKLIAGEKPIIVELDPPFGSDISKVMKSAQRLSDAGIDMITLSDSPMGRSRMDPMLLGTLMQQQCGVDVMPHVACRDRNIIGLRGGLLGSYAAGIRHFLMVTGDPVPAADRNQITPVFDYNSIRFMNMARLLNDEEFSNDRIIYGGALNYHGRNPDAIAKRMGLKIEQGASFFLTQPVYGADDARRIAYLKEKTGARILCGLMPLVSYRNALFMSTEMPGIHVPDEIVGRYSADMTREEAEETAREVTLDICDQIRDVTDGYYFMVPFNRVSLICSIINEIRDRYF